MRVLLLGSNGQVGTELRRSLAPLGTVIAGTRKGSLDDGTPCEVADFDAPESLRDLVERVAPDVVVNAAAHTQVDKAESEPEAAFRANAESPAVLAAACERGNALLVHYSTDYVFNGSGNRPYREDDPVAPLGVYGESKLAGEQAIQRSGARHLIFRTAWVYAGHGRNFMRTMLRLAGERDELRVVADQYGTPTPAALIADVTARILAQGQAPDAGGLALPSGLWHLTPTGQTSWHGFAEAIVDRAHALGRLAKRPRVVPITTPEFPTPAARPAYSVLDCGKLQREFGIELPGWQEALDGVLHG
jgi:dTDP-4-dehydrorhamnose reductase